MTSLQEKFDTKLHEMFIPTWWDKIRFWFLVRKIRRVKLNTLWEANMDKLYYETQFSDQLNYKDDADRKALMEENRKPLSEQDPLKITELEDRITRAKTVQGAYYKNESFIADTKVYLFMLEEWLNPQNENLE